MALDAGSVFTVLSGKFSPAGFNEFDAANKRAVRSAVDAEGRMVASSGRISQAQERIGTSAKNAAASTSRLAQAAPLAMMDNWGKSSSKAADNLGKLGTIATTTA